MKKSNFQRILPFNTFLILTLAAAANASFAQQNKPTAQPTNPLTEQKAASQPQTAATPDPFASIPAANPADVSSLDAIVKAVYNVISGDAGTKRDWNRFRSLFYPGARLIPTGMNPTTKQGGGRVFTPEEYIERSSPLMAKEGFYESEIARRTETFSTITHVFSTYESKHKLADEKGFQRGVNSIQLLNDGKRWWILTIAWSGETPETPLPEKYLKAVEK